MRAKVSVVVVNYFSRSCLSRCMDHIFASDFRGELEVFLVNNSPQDGSSDWARETYPQLRVLDSPINQGFGPANNLAFEHTSGSAVLLVNPDAFLPADAIQKSFDYLNTHEKVAAIGPQFINLEGAPQPSARMFPTIFDKLFLLSGLAARYPKSRLFGRMDQTWCRDPQPRRVDWVVGAFMMIKAKPLALMKGFDPRFFLYFEELDLCKRLARAGYEVHFLPQVVVRHQGGASSDHAEGPQRSGKQLTLLRLFSEALYYAKYYGVVGPLVMLGLERWWFRMRLLKNIRDPSPVGRAKRRAFRYHLDLIGVALKVTRYGRESPPRPWSTEPTDYLGEPTSSTRG